MESNNTGDNVIIADSQFLITEALTSLLRTMDGVALIHVADSKFELSKLLYRSDYSLFITDPGNIDFDGYDDLKAIKTEFPGMPVLVLANTLNKSIINDLAQRGIRNVISKSADRDEIVTAIEMAIKGKKYYSADVLDMILDAEDNRVVVEEPNLHLTNSEVEIVRLIASGLTTKEIANQKNISFHTVNTHRKNIFRKAGVSNVSELIIYAIKGGWIDNIEYYI